MNGGTVSAVHTKASPRLSPGPSGLLQRECACGQHTFAGGECEECRKKRKDLRRHATGFGTPAGIPAIVYDVLRTPGQPLDGATRAFMESRFGHDFSRVRIHTDAHAGQSANSVGARAFTVGSQIVFAPNQYQRDSERGRRLIAHELAHVVQQGAIDGGSAGLTRISEPDEVSEREAEIASEQAIHEGGTPRQAAQAPGVVRRDPDPDVPRGGSEGQRRVQVSIAVLGDCPNPRKIAEAIPGARSMLLTAENWFIDYPALEPVQQKLFDLILRAHFGFSSDEVRSAVQSKIIRMSRLMDSAMNAGVTFDCTPASAQKCAEEPWAMYVSHKERNTIHVCNDFYASELEFRRFTLMHESAHLAGIGDQVYLRTYGPIGTGECVKPSGLSTATALNNADSYAWVVWCLSREPGTTILTPVDLQEAEKKSKR